MLAGNTAALLPEPQRTSLRFSILTVLPLALGFLWAPNSVCSHTTPQAFPLPLLKSLFSNDQRLVQADCAKQGMESLISVKHGQRVASHTAAT